MKVVVSLLLPVLTLFAVDINFENSNILDKTHDYNRFRIQTDFTDEKYPNIYARVILDNENIYNFEDKKNSNKNRVYRAILGYLGEKHSFALGLQRVPFGVGRIWNPIDIFNPIDITAIETSERKGTEAFVYEYAINQLSNLDLTISKNKSSFRVKSFLSLADFAVVLIDDKKNDLEIIGYEVEGEIPKSKITVRSEGGRFEDKKRDKIYYDYIIGAEYGFENSLVVLGEFRHNTDIDTKQAALNLSYQPSPLLTLNILGLKNLDDKSQLIAPSFTYSLSDESSLQVGAFSYSKRKIEDQIFGRYFINF